MLKFSLKTKNNPSKKHQFLKHASQQEKKGPVTLGCIGDIYPHLYPIIYRRCYKILADEMEAADATQDIFLLLCHKARSFRAEASLVTWVYRITLNHCLNRLRSRQARSRLQGQFSQMVVSPEMERLEKTLESREIIKKIILGCTEAEIELLLAACVDNLTQREIGDALGISDRSVRKRLRLVKDRLDHKRKSLGEHPSTEVPSDLLAEAA